MMTEKIEDPAADIAWMRRVAEEGRQGPMQGASILFGAGLIYGVASLGHWAVASGVANVGMEAVNYIWLAATLLFFLLLVPVLTRLKRDRGVVTSANLASGTAWASVGWGIFALAVSMAALTWRLGGEAAMVTLALMPSVIMVFYGSGWAVTAAMQRSKSLWALAIASFAAAPLASPARSRP